MSVKRFIGTETEYAVTAAHGNPVQWSFDVIAGAADERTRRIRWDYRQEDPVNDMRGRRLERAAARPDMLTDEPQPHITNVLADNGGRLYVDHAHPEYSSPETTDPFTAVVYDTAGDMLMRRAAARANADGRADGTLRPVAVGEPRPFKLVPPADWQDKRSAGPAAATAAKLPELDPSDDWYCCL